jgi:hypothetical protein
VKEGSEKQTKAWGREKEKKEKREVAAFIDTRLSLCIHWSNSQFRDLRTPKKRVRAGEYEVEGAKSTELGLVALAGPREHVLTQHDPPLPRANIVPHCSDYTRLRMIDSRFYIRGLFMRISRVRGW